MILQKRPDQPPLISIIVRTKDRPKILNKALKSIYEQTYRPIEVVLVNDGGCDLELYHIKSILNDITLNYIRLDQNRGRAHALNLGIEHAKGNYIGFLDDDDEFYPDHISSIIPLLNSLDYHIAYADTELIYKRYNPDKQELEDADRRIFISKDFSYKDILLENYIPLISIIFSRDVFVNIGMFDEDLDIYEDWDYLIRCSQCYHFYHVPKVTAKYIQWSDVYQIAQSKEHEKIIDKSYEKIIDKHKDKFSPEIIKYYRDKINMLEAKLKDKDLIIKDLELSIGEKERVMRDLEKRLKDKEEYLNFIKSGRGWRLLSKYYKLRDSILNFFKKN
ncbi:MAG: glycosyltransferase [Thermodesulfovibrionales bacterium]|nr:glycosyltransferase [Thermodesulfovibrionales bacterium]